MSTMKYYGLELIEQLCAEFGPSGCCDNVREAIITQIADVIDAYYVDRTGTIIVKVCGGGQGYNADKPRRVLITMEEYMRRKMNNELDDISDDDL